MEGYTLKQLKGFNFEVTKDMFDKAFKRVNTFVDYKTKLVEGSEKRAEDSTKRVGTKLEQKVAKKQKIDDAKVDDDQEEARMKEHMNIVPDEEEVAIDAIPLATKPPCINFDKDDLETLWKLVKAKHGSTRPEEGYERLFTLSEVAIYAYLYAGRENVSPYTCNNHRVNATGTKLQLLTELQLLMDKQ
ncbi:hypothetical protein Tco_0604218 [Tanacetum coccineum]